MNDLRQVRTARFRASGAEAVNRAAILFEDALRTASLPRDRLLLVRRADLGVIRTSAPPSSIALRIEGQLADWESFAVPGESAESAAAPAVWFASPLEAVVRAAIRIARGEALTEWYWPCVLGIAPAPASRSGEALAVDTARITLPVLARRTISLSRASDEGARCAAVIALWRRLVLEGVSRLWLERMTEGEAREMLVLAGFQWIGPESIRMDPESAPEPAPSMAVNLAAEDFWQLAPMMRRWAVAMRVSEDRPWIVLEPARWTRSVAAVLDSAEARQNTERAPLDPQSSATRPTREQADPPAIAPERESPRDQASETPRPTSEWHRLPTEAGGLCFVIPILIRLGFPAWLAEEESRLESGFPAKLLRAILDAVGIEPEDAILPAFDSPPDERTRPWIRGIRLWLRRNARMRLSTLIRRPARFHFTETHWDFFLPLSGADLRIRRLALDIDPGWVPWLGRVVSYHYEHGID